MTNYRCRVHPDEQVSWRGTGCVACANPDAPHDPHADRRQARDLERIAHQLRQRQEPK